MCNSREEPLGKGVPSLAQSIISNCSRTWCHERRVSVLRRTLKPRISVWDCVPEHIVVIQLRNTFNNLPEQRNYLLDHANPASAVVRSIRRLDGHQSPPLVLNSSRFDSEREVDADHCAQGSDFTLKVSKSDSADDRTISRASTPSPAAVSEYKEGETHSIALHLELEEEADRDKPEQGIIYSETENVIFCSSTGQSELDLDDEAFSTEAREPSTTKEPDEVVENHQKYDEPAKANSPEPTELFTTEEPDEDVENDQKYDEPAEANSPEPTELFTTEEPDEDAENNQKYNEPAEANSPEPRELFTIEECDEDIKDDQQCDEPAEASNPEPRELPTIYECDEDVEDDQQYDEPAEANSPEPLQLSPVHQSHIEFESDHRNDEPLEAESPEPQRLSHFRLESPVPDYEDNEKDDDSTRSESHAPRRLFPVHQSHPTVYDPPHSAPQTETFCPAALRRFLEPEERVRFDEFNDWFVEMHMNRHPAIDTNPEKSIPGTPSPESQRLSDFRVESPAPDYGDDEKDDDSSRSESPAPRRLFPVHQSHPTMFDPPHSAPQTRTWCPAPMRRFLEPEERLKFDAFNDWFVEMHMNRHTAIDTNPEKFNSGAPSPENCRLLPFRQTSPVSTYGDDEKDDDSSRSESPAPRRLFPVHQPQFPVYDPPQPAPQMETYCPAPLRRFLEPEERLKFDAFNDWFVEMHMNRHTAIDTNPEKSIPGTPSPEPQRLSHLRVESPVPDYGDDEKDDDSSRSESPAPRRLFPVNQPHFPVCDPPQPAPQMETYCPAPLRQFLEPEERLNFDAFNDWFVEMHMNRHTAIDTNPKKSIPGTPSPEPQRLSHFRLESPIRDYGDDEKDECSSRAESPAPRRLFPVHQPHFPVYDPPQPAPQMETYCPAPLRRFLEPEERLKFDAFEDWFVRMHTSRHTAIDASLEPRRLDALRRESPVPKCDNDEKYHESFEVEPWTSTILSCATIPLMVERAQSRFGM